jgi:hypothetical protein
VIRETSGADKDILDRVLRELASIREESGRGGREVIVTEAVRRQISGMLLSATGGRSR